MGYRGRLVKWIEQTLGWTMDVVQKPRRWFRVAPPPHGKVSNRQRNRIERLVGRLKQFRAVATRYDKLDVMVLGGVMAALTLIHLR